MNKPKRMGWAGEAHYVEPAWRITLRMGKQSRVLMAYSAEHANALLAATADVVVRWASNRDEVVQ